MMSEVGHLPTSYATAGHKANTSLSGNSGSSISQSLSTTNPPLVDHGVNTSNQDSVGGEEETGVPVTGAMQDVDTSVVTGENDLTMAEQTLVEGVNGAFRMGDSKKTHTRDPSSSTLSLPTRDMRQTTHIRDGSRSSLNPLNSTTWDPLKGEKFVENVKGFPYDETVIVEENDIVDSEGKLLFSRSDSETKPSPLHSRRASHLRLDIKPASPMPWDQVDPPLDNNAKSIVGYSPASSQKFRTLQNSGGGPRPLIPKSSYYFGPPPSDSAYGTHPIGQIGVHHPREILRVERDYTGGEVIQFAPIYPLELEGRITPTHFLESINAINELLISAHSLRHSFFDNILAIFTLQISKLFLKSHFEKEMDRLHRLIMDLNTELYNPVGLNILWPRNVAFLYLEIEYY